MALYKNTSNYGPGVEISPILWVLGFQIEIKKEIFSSPEHNVLRVSYCDQSLSGAFRKLQRFEFLEELWLLWQPKEKTLKIFLSQTIKARAFIFGM